MTSIAYLGLGTMGRGMVANLTAAGHDVTVHNRTPTDVSDLGARSAGSVAEALEGAEVVLYCLADDAAVRAVVLGEGGVAEVATASQVVVDLSTISPGLSDEEAAAFAARGVPFLDAPVFGSKGEAAAGGLWIVAGGDADVLARVRPVLDVLAETVHHLGPQGSGARMKLVGNLLVAAQLEALGEALTLARSAGLDLATVLEVLAVTDFRSPIFDGVGPTVLAGDYSPSFALDLMVKDAGLIQDFADSLGTPVPTVAVVRSSLDEAVERGYGGENASALIKVVAARAGVDLAGAPAAG
ncbi:NAD(P)-dependent oxidoreductase [Aquipuribacter hungaricus]|uniref:NAD(P)-dependent oxidoreductase n=1 Tax=Aquipuribacter hungaricus TaxID=545624 RepID=A0ABV7WFJ6_9MICO